MQCVQNMPAPFAQQSHALALCLLGQTLLSCHELESSCYLLHDFLVIWVGCQKLHQALLGTTVQSDSLTTYCKQVTYNIVGAIAAPACVTLLTEAKCGAVALTCVCHIGSSSNFLMGVNAINKTLLTCHKYAAVTSAHWQQGCSRIVIKVPYCPSAAPTWQQQQVLLSYLDALSLSDGSFVVRVALSQVGQCPRGILDGSLVLAPLE